MPCEERARLEKIYLDAVVELSRAGVHIADMKSEAWREATKATREACQDALDDLNTHRQEHGC